VSQFFIRRLILLLPVLLGITFVTFALARILPGDPCYAVLGEKATVAQCDAFLERYGFNDPIPVQFARYLTDIFHGDFGESLRYRRDALRLAGEQSVRVLLLCVAVLGVAGLIEAFLSPTLLPIWAKLSVGALTGALLWAYVIFVGRRAAGSP